MSMQMFSLYDFLLLGIRKMDFKPFKPVFSSPPYPISTDIKTNFNIRPLQITSRERFLFFFFLLSKSILPNTITNILP